MNQSIQDRNGKRPFYKPKLNLGARLTLSIGGIMLISSMAIFTWLYRLQEAQAMRQVETEAEAILSEMMVVRDWVSEYGDVWTTEPGMLYVEGRDGFYRKSPGMVTKEISTIANARENYRFHLTSLNLTNADNAPDDFEMAALNAFEENPATFTEIEVIDGQRYFRQMIPLYAQSSCLECHQGYQIGDVRGGISVLVPMAEVDGSLMTGRRLLVATAVFITLLMMGTLYGLVRRMVAHPLTQLQDAASAMGEGDFQAACNLHTGDELQALGETFNQMAGNLKTYQDSLHGQIDQRTNELDALSAMALTISSGNDLETILSEALAQALQATVMSNGIIRLKNTTNSTPSLIHHGLSAVMVKCVDAVADNDQCVLWNVQAGHQLIDLTTDWNTCGDCLDAALHLHEYHSALIVPLRAGNRILGTLTLLQKGETEVSSEQTQFVACMGNQLGVAIENARFQTKMKRLTILEERGRIARDLHDSLAQTLSWLHLKMDILTQTLDSGDIPQIRQEAGDMQQVVGQACVEVRESIDDLRHSHRIGLETAMEIEVEAFIHENEQTIALSIGEACHLMPETEVEAIRILQEALTNIRKHANAQHVDVRVQRQNGSVELSIHDDGQGFAPYDLHEGSHYGLQIMHERAVRGGGTLHVYTAPDAGTQIVASFPAETDVSQTAVSQTAVSTNGQLP